MPETQEYFGTSQAPQSVVPAEWAASRDIRFRPGQGGEMSPEWAAYMLNLWWSAGNGKLTFAEAVKLTSVHFLVGEQ